MLIVNTRLGASPIHGVGVFVLEPIAQGQAISEDDPRAQITFTPEQVEALPDPLRRFIEAYGWPSAPDRDEYILTVDNEKYMNHSTAPNIDQNGIALRDIEVGEELTIDYADLDNRFEESEFRTGASR
ncbi:MAG: SET domain-containing protein-lysine N-methyltransferase [Planctomycetota bacterium]